MGLLDQVLGGMLGSSSTRGGTNSPVMDALMALLRSQGSGGLGGGFGDTDSRLAPQRRADSGFGGATGGGLGGGLGGLLESFNRAGHSDIADSWVSTGQNRPIQSNQLEEALGANTIDRLAQQTGMRRDELLRELSTHLPNAVDRLTPEGRLPRPEQMNHW